MRSKPLVWVVPRIAGHNRTTARIAAADAIAAVLIVLALGAGIDAGKNQQGKPGKGGK